MDERRTYEQTCRDAATAQGLDPIAQRLAAEGVQYSVEQTGGFVMLIRIPLADPAWIGVTASDTHPDDTWTIVRYRDDADEGTLMSRGDSDDWAADAAVAAIREHTALARSVATGTATRLVNAYVVYAYPDAHGGTYTVLGPGAWGRPDEALGHAQRQRDTYHERHGATPLTDAPWRREISYRGHPALYHPPAAAAGIEIRDVHTGERWFVPTVGSPLGPIGPRTPDTPRWQARPPDVAPVVGGGADPPTAAARQPDPPRQEIVEALRHRLDSLGAADPPDLGL